MAEVRTFELVEGTSAKFWEISQDGLDVEVRYGRIGTAGQSKVKTFADAGAAAAHAIKLIGEKTRKGYAETATAPAEAAPAPKTGKTAEEKAEDKIEEKAEDKIEDRLDEVPVDEDALVVPAAWRRFRMPRRGSGTPAPAISAANVKKAEALLTGFRAEITAVVTRAGTPPEIRDAALAYLDGVPAAAPLGAAATVTAAVVAVTDGLGWSHRGDVTVFADLWRARHGLPFTAAAVTELLGLSVTGGNRGTGQSGVIHRSGGKVDDYVHKLAQHVRRAAAAAGDDEYAAVEAALAALRGGNLQQRAVTSMMLPDRTDWVEADYAAAQEPGAAVVTDLLMLSVGSPAQARHLITQVSPWVLMRDAAFVHTLVESVGTAIAPILAELSDSAYGTDDKQRLYGILATLPTDEAFGLLLDRIGEPHVRTAVAEAAGRFPRRALRLLAAADQPAVADLRRAHVAAHLDLVPQVLADLDEAGAARLTGLVAELAALAVPVAPAEALPPVLVTPPWLHRAPVKPTVVDGLTCTDPLAVRWAPGERDKWRVSPVRYAPDPPADLVQQIAAGRASAYYALNFFLTADEGTARPLLAGWVPDDLWHLTNRSTGLLARFEEAAVPMLLNAARRAPSSLAPVLAPVESPEVAVLMATWHAKLKSVRPVAAAWFARHPDAAARALVPVAVGKPGAGRTQAETALRTIAATGHAERIRSAASGYGQPAAAVVEEILAVDPLTILPVATVPKVPAWAEPALLAPVRLADGSGALPAEAVRHLITMLAISRLDTPYAGLAIVQQFCVPADLADFAWSVFHAWQQAGSPAKESWALDALGLLGDDETVRRLTPVIRAWPGEGGHTRAVTGLDVLATIGTDVALMYLNGIAQKVKFKGLKDRAEEKIAELAAGLGLTADELADRLVPDLGLGADGSLTLDYGRRTFTVGFDEQLRPYVMDAGGKPLKALPKPGVQDDSALAPEAYQQFAALKKDVRAVAADQIRRLEQAMVTQRRWDAATFRRLFVDHPLVWHLVRRLAWIRFAADGTPLGGVRVAEDRTFADVHDEPVELGAGELIGVAHPLQLGADVAAWAEVFADYEILQPFAQLGREVHRLEPGEATATRLARMEDREVPVGKLLGLERHGWRRGEPLDAGVQGWMQRDLPGELRIFAEIEPGIAVGLIDEFPDQRIEKVWIGNRGDDPWRRNRTETRFGTLDPVLASEILRDLTEVFA